MRATPFDVLVLARHLRTTTTEVLRRYVDVEFFLARRSERGPCVFLGDRGCTVHPARPLACRLYPLGREVVSNGGEHFFFVQPHPESEGIYGERGSVDDYLAQQETQEHIEAADRYLELFCRAVSALGSAPDLSSGTIVGRSDLLDADATIAKHHPDSNPAELGAVESMRLHIQTIDRLLSQPQGSTS